MPPLPSSLSFLIVSVYLILCWGLWPIELEFYKENGKLIIDSEDYDKVQVDSIKIQQGHTGLITNAKINGKITIGVTSNPSNVPQFQ